jgi:FkbM family methyltransferase
MIKPFESLYNSMKYILNHPLNRKSKINAFFRFIRWQIIVRVNPYPIVYPFGEKTKLIISRSMHGATGNYYCGLDEFSDMAFVLHFLRKDDLFVDIGANIGSYTLLASGEVGANTVSIEPIPKTFSKLKENLSLNNLNDRVRVLNIGLGGKKGVLNFTKSLDAENHVATSDETDMVEVIIEKFDDIIDIIKPTIIKIDVEGFETEVLNGMQSSLNNPYLKGIIIELNGSGRKYGFDETIIHNKLLTKNFQPYEYLPFERKLVKAIAFSSKNSLYLRDLEFVCERVSTAKKIKVFDQEF